MSYTWRVGDVFTNGTYRWRVDSVEGNKAVLQSCSTSWATTRPLTLDEWIDGGRWRLDGAACGAIDGAQEHAAATAASAAQK